MNPQEIMERIGAKISTQNFDKRLLRKAESAGNRSQAEEIRKRISCREQEINKLRGDLDIQRRKLSPFAVYRSKAVAANFNAR